MVVQGDLAGADDLVALNNGGQVRPGTVLAVDAGKVGAADQIAGRQRDGEVQLFHRVFKAAQQRDLQLKHFFLVNGDHADGIGNGIIEGQADLTDQALGDLADVRLNGGIGFAGSHGRAVHGDACGIGGQREGQTRFPALQPQGHAGIHQAVTL